MVTSETTEELTRNLAKDFDRQRALLCGLIEAMGLPEKQERQAVGLVKALSYEAQGRISRTLRNDG